MNGNGYTISNLSLGASAPSEAAGLFDDIGTSGSVQNLNVFNENVSPQTADTLIAAGALAGINNGAISNVNVTGSVTSLFGATVGGLVGDNFGSVTASHANALVQGCCNGIGGLVGTNETGATVTQSSSAGAINLNFANGLGCLGACVGGYFGGLVGSNYGAISQSFSTGNVTTDGYHPFYAAGLAGINAGTITQSYSTGNVTAIAIAGGLVGQVGTGTISQTYATGSTYLLPTVYNLSQGGLIGLTSTNNNSVPYATVSNSYWDTQSTGQSLATGNNVTLGATGLTTAQLQSGILPAGFNPAVWSATAGQYPTLTGVSAPVSSLSPTVAANLSNLAYLSAQTIMSGSLPAGYSLPLGYSVASLNGTLLELGDPSQASLHAIVFQGPSGLVIAFEGTVLPGPPNLGDLLTSQSVWADLGLTGGANGELSSFYQSAQNFLSIVQAFAKQNGNEPISLTGHSLGGAVAQVLGSVTGLNTLTFNAPGTSEFMQTQGLVPSPSSNNSNIYNYRFADDLVSLLPGQNTQVGNVITYGNESSSILNQLDFTSNHSITTLLALLGTTPTSDLTPNANGSTDTSSLYSQTGPLDLTALGISAIGNVLNGVETFDITVSAGVQQFLAHLDDPVGFDFVIGSGDPNFASVTLPMQLDAYDLQELINGLWQDEGLIQPLETVLFADGGIDEFRLFDIDPSNDPFIVGVTFVADGEFTGSITPISTVPEPSSIKVFLTAILLLIFCTSTLRHFRRRYRS